MSEHVAHGLNEEISIWPITISAGILFALPLAFSFRFVYENGLYASLCLGIGVPLILAGIIGWTREAIGGGGPGENLGPPAMGWFILAEALIFVSFFVTYWVVRLGADAWPPEGNIELPKILPAIMTLILLVSSFTIHIGEEKLSNDDRVSFLKWLMLTMGLGLAFLGMSAYEWNHLFHAGFTPDKNIFSTAFFSITGFHGAHVIVGLGIFLAILIPAFYGTINHSLIKAGSLYWHFVDVIWFFVVSQMYYWT